MILTESDTTYLPAHRNWGGSPERHILLSSFSERLSCFVTITSGGPTENRSSPPGDILRPNRESTDSTKPSCRETRGCMIVKKASSFGSVPIERAGNLFGFLRLRRLVCCSRCLCLPRRSFDWRPPRNRNTKKWNQKIGASYLLPIVL